MLNPAQAFLAPERLHDLEYGRRYGAAGERHAQRLGDVAQLEARLLGMAPDQRLESRRLPVGLPLERRRERLEGAAARLEQARGLAFEGKGRIGDQEACGVGELDQGFRARLQA